MVVIVRAVQRYRLDEETEKRLRSVTNDEAGATSPSRAIEERSYSEV